MMPKVNGDTYTIFGNPWANTNLFLSIQRKWDIKTNFIKEYRYALGSKLL